MKVLATNNCGANAKIRYSIRDQPVIKKFFNIDDQSGTICIEDELDYEKTTKYQLTVIAHDSSGHSGSALVNVHVEDVNDNSPVFYPADYNVSVREDTPVGSPLLVLSANDADEGAYGQVRYRIVSGGSDVFRLEPQTGYLYVQSRLTKKSYDVVVQAKDGGGLVSEHKANVHVSVITPSTPTPQFTSNLYTFTAAEDILPGISIGQVSASGPFPITYTIYSGDPDHLFTIDPHSGKITVSRYLDADKWGSILLNVQAWMDGGGANHTQVVVELSDANDNEPHFEMDHVEAYVPEDHSIHLPFFAVQAIDHDRGKNGEITYSLVHADPSCPVAVRPLTGELALSASLDYEKITRYELVIKARDQGIPPRSSNITVVLNVIDVNDNAPQFDMHLYIVEVSEDVALMTDIVTMRAKDADSEHNGKISFRIADEIPEFGIHSNSGNVYVKSVLDREKVSEYRLVVIASDNGQPPLSSNATLQINVLDVNDNSPNCSSVVPLTLNDDTAPNVTFGSITATDSDQGPNGTITYRIQNEDPYFTVKSSGEVMLKRKISQFVAGKEYRLSVIASDNGKDARSAVCQIRINFEKIQSKVKFVEPIDRMIRLNESCLSDCYLIKLNATNVAHWEIEINEISHFFTVKKDALWTTSKFDENFFKMSRLLSLTAYDSDGRKRQLIFTIAPLERKALDFNNSTVFLRLSRTVPVGTKLTTVGKQSDQAFWRLINETDIVQLDELTSSLYSTSNFALLNSTSFVLGVKRVSVPDYSQQNFMVYFDIEQQNLHRPVFRDCPLPVTIQEDERIGTLVTKVGAIDADWGLDGQVTYRIINSTNSPISIDATSGDVYLTRSLDWSKDHSMLVVVEAQDHASEVLNRKRSTCAIFIEVKDVNNNTPQFLSSTNISVSDEIPSNGIIHYVVAKDDDYAENALINYTIVAGNDNETFEINSFTGAISLLHRIRTARTIRVRATDNGKPPKYAEQSITFHMASTHRQWEYFTQSNYLFSVPKDAPVGTFIHDFYSIKFERPRLTLLSNRVGDTEIFTIADDGKLRTSEVLTAKDYTLVVIAVNNKNLTDWASVKVHLLNGNRNPPRITSSSCGNLTVPENTRIDQLTRIFAVDSDEGDDALVKFNIVAGNENNTFSINQSTGIVSCRELDREQKSEYFLVITAEDYGVPARADTCTIRITVSDVNDNAPVFSDDTPEYIEVNDRTPIGAVLARISARDSDEGVNGKVIYSIVEDKSGLLDIRYQTGEIIYARDLPTTQKEFVLKIRAQDEGNSQVLSTEQSIRFLMKQSKSEWDNLQPSFLSQHYTGVIKEGQPKGQLVLKISSSERLFNDAPLTYSIISGNVDSAFDINSDGYIRTTQELDREIENEYELKVVGNAHHYRTIPQTTVHIRVLNINDNVPALAPMRPRKISEAAQVGTLIATVRATDVDVDTQLEYSISPPNPLFMINRLTGTIHLASPLDYETTQEHRLPIQVSDGENISKSTLVVVVLDENDNAPKFDKDFYDVTVPQNLAIGSAITKMTARDVDSGLAGQVYYNISTASDRFQMDSQSGVLKLKSRLAFGSVHYVKVQAFDYGLPQMSAAVTLRISVNDSANRVQAKFNKKSYSFSIPENTSANVRIGNIRASIMPDAKFDYRIIEPECARLVRIDHNGDVFLQQQIDREKNQTLKFTVEASSRSSFVNATTIVHIQLLDTNDNVPQFFASTDKIIVNEHMKHGELLVRMSASDRDAGKNGRITYSILSGNEHGMFRLDSASGTIAFEQWNEQTLLLSEPIQKLVVAAQDHGDPSRWNHTTISVSIERQLWSGSAPFFALPSYQASVFENTQVGSVVLKSRAVSRSGIIEPGWEYTLKDNDEAFACNRTTGDIILVKELDFETRNGYQFSLIVKDQSRRSAIVPINVIVLGIDEYPPMFMRNKYTFQIPRTAEIGQRVGAVTATDQDSGIDGVVRYEMEGDALRYLGIDPDSGQIVLTRELSEKMRKNVSFDEFVVIASSGTRQYSRVKVFIEIGDFTSSNSPNAKESLMNAKILTIASLVLLFVLLLTLVVIIIRMRIRVYKQRKPRKQVYSVSRGNVAVMADLHRLSPRFEYEKQRAHVPTPSTSSNNRPSSLSLSRCSDESIRMRQKISIDNMISARSASRSVPDSGIDPDDMSITSSVTEYLTQIGVTQNKVFEQKKDCGYERIQRVRNDMRYDPDLNDLIYAKVDEILSPTARLNASFPSNPSLNIPSLNTSPFKSNPSPSFQPLLKVLSQLNNVDVDYGDEIVNVEI